MTSFLEGAMDQDFRLKDYLACISRMTLLSDEEQGQAFEAWKLGDERARRLLEERHLIAVVAWASAYRGAGLSLLGLIETGNRGMLKALRRAGPARADEFLDYLRLAVEEEIESTLVARRGA